MTSLLFVYNAKAGKATDFPINELIDSYLPEGYEAAVCPIDELQQIESSHPAKIMVAIGGDGTVNAVAKRCVETNKILAVIPRGSGDGLARHRGIPHNIRTALQLIAEANTIRVDTVRVNDQFCLNICGTGFEGRVAHYFGSKTKRGLKGYIKAIRELYFSYPVQQVQFELDGSKPYNGLFFSLSVANGSQWGNNFEVASDASMRDGQLEIAIMQKPKWHQVLTVLRALRKHKQVDSRLVKYFKAATLVLSASESNWHIDGEAVCFENKVRIDVVRNNLQMIVPKE